MNQQTSTVQGPPQPAQPIPARNSAWRPRVWHACAVACDTTSTSWLAPVSALIPPRLIALVTRAVPEKMQSLPADKAVVKRTASKHIQSLPARQAAAALSQQIGACCSWQELSNMWSRLGQHMNAIHMAAMLVKAAKLERPNPTEHEQAAAFTLFVGSALAAVPRVLPSCRAREASSLAWAAAKLGAMPGEFPTPDVQLHRHPHNGRAPSTTPWQQRPPAPPPALPPPPKQQLLHRAAGGTAPLDVLGAAPPVQTVMHYTGYIERQGSSNTVHNTQVLMPVEWWQSMMCRCEELLPQFNGQDTSMLLWAVVALQQHQEAQHSRHAHSSRTTTDQQQQQIWQDVPTDADAFNPGPNTQHHTHPHHSDHHTSTHTHSRHTYNSFTQIIPQGFLLRLMALSQPQLHLFSAQALSGTIWAMARLRILPNSEWQDQFLECSARQLTHSEPEGLANIAWALAVMEAAPPTHWLTAFLTSSLSSVSRATPASLARLLWASARFPNFTPPREWVAAMCRAAEPQLSLFAPQDLANMLWAASSLNYQPTGPWMQSAVSHLVHTAPLAQALEVSAFLLALARLQYHPGADALSRITRHVIVPGAGAQALCNTLWALATLKAKPPRPVLQAALSGISHHMEELGPQELGQLWWSLGAFRANLPRDLMEELREELRVQQEVMRPHEMAMVLSGHARLHIHIPKVELDQMTSQMLTGIKQQLLHGGHGEQRPIIRTVLLVLGSLARMAHHSTWGAVNTTNQAAFVHALLMHCAYATRATRHYKAFESAAKQHQGLLPGWTPRDVALVIHAMSALKLRLPAPWAGAAMRCLARSHGQGSASGEQDQSESPHNHADPTTTPVLNHVDTITLIVSSACHLHSHISGSSRMATKRAARRVALEAIIGTSRARRSTPPPTTSTSNRGGASSRVGGLRNSTRQSLPLGMPLVAWTRVFGSLLSKVEMSDLTQLTPERLASLCWALSYLAARCSTATHEYRVVMKQVSKAYTHAVDVARDRAVAGLLDPVQLSVVLRSLAGRRHRLLRADQAQGVATELLQSMVMGLQSSVRPDLRACCQMMAAVGRLDVLPSAEWLWEVGRLMAHGLQSDDHHDEDEGGDERYGIRRGDVKAATARGGGSLSVTDCEMALGGLQSVLGLLSRAGSAAGTGAGSAAGTGAGSAAVPPAVSPSPVLRTSELLGEVVRLLQVRRAKLLQARRHARLAHRAWALAR